MLQWKPCRQGAKAPKKTHAGDSGYDISACFLPTVEENQDLQKPCQSIEIDDEKEQTRFVRETPEGSFVMVVPPLCRAKIPTGVTVAFPIGVDVKVEPRSGLAWNEGLHVMGGIVDSNYRGEVMVIVYNTSLSDVRIADGARVAQLVPRLLAFHNQLEFQFAETLPDSDGRGVQGFGSTGTS
jgi:dUTP pyrophosphatase